MGDSITDFWRNAEGPFAGKPVLDKHFGQWKIANFGIAGDTTQGVLYRLQNGEGKGFSPKAVMLMIGTNNTARNTAAEIAEGIGAVVLELQRDFPAGEDPAARRVSPRPPRRSLSAPRLPISTAPSRSCTMATRCTTSTSAPQSGRQRHGFAPDVMSDLLHPGPKGYEIWAQAVKEPLSRLMAGR